jgi:hypothetical protein
MHQAVELILKRMGSNPDEFTGDDKDRWMRMIKHYEAFFSDEERKAISEKYNAIMMGKFHKDVMSELLYGEERRQQERETQTQMELEQMKQQRMRQLQAQMELEQMKQQQMRQLQAMRNVYPNPIYSMHNAASNTVALQSNANIQSDTLTLGGETIDKSLIQKLKELVK